MNERENPFKNIKVVLRRSHPLTKAVVLVALVLSMAALVTLGTARENAEDRAAQLRTQAAQLEQENSALEQKIEKLGTVQSIEEIAAEELGLADPNAVIIGSGN